MRLLSSLAVAATLVAVASPAYAHNHDALSSRFRLNNFDWGGSSAGDRFSWDFDARVGTAENRIFFRSEGEMVRGQMEDAEIQLFYNRPISEFWDFNVGWRRDFFPTNRNYAALGLSGIAPNFYEVEATAYLSEQGVAAGRLELSTDLLPRTRSLWRFRSGHVPQAEVDDQCSVGRRPRAGPPTQASRTSGSLSSCGTNSRRASRLMSKWAGEACWAGPRARLAMTESGQPIAMRSSASGRYSRQAACTAKHGKYHRHGNRHLCTGGPHPCRRG
jgi:hypothetical protein